MRLAIAELGRQSGRIDPKAMVAIAAVGLLAGLSFWALDVEPPNPAAGIFRVTADDDARLLPAVAADQRFSLVEEKSDLHLSRDGVVVADNVRGRAAYEVLVSAVQVWQDDQLSAEANQGAAFPVSVVVAYELRANPDLPAATPAPPSPAPTPGPSTPVIDQVDHATPAVRGLQPKQVEPPFPIRSLLLTFAYVLPASLLAQVHASSLHGERTRHRGVMLLSAPVSSFQILLGKSAPGLLSALAVATGITLWLQAGVLAFLAACSFLGFLFALTSYLAVISRSPRELSLLQVASTTLLNVFLFLPPMFPSIPPVAFLSPVHVVASGIRGDPVSVGQFLYATMPLSLAAAALGSVAVGLLREEHLFSVLSAPRRLLGAVGVLTRKWWQLALAGAMVVPFVFAAQILVLVMVSVVGLEAAFIVWLPLSVLLEESAKALPIFAAKTRAWRSGLLVGTGFFVAEKGYLVLTLVGFRSLPFGDEALAILGTGPGIFLLILPWFLHVATATLLAAGATRKRWLGFLAAVAVHLAYDQILLGGAF